MIELSELHRTRFGCITARAEIKTAADLRTARAFCAEMGVDLLIARLPVERLTLAQELLADGGLLTDTLAVFQKSLTGVDTPPGPALAFPAELTIRRAVPEDAAAMREIAQAAFHDFLGHYHADPRLDRKACDEVYVDWASRLCLQPPGVKTWIAEMSGATAGFAGANYANPAETVLELGGVSPMWRGYSLYRHLIRMLVADSAALGVARFTAATQLANIAAQSAFLREGLLPAQFYHTIHKWFQS